MNKRNLDLLGLSDGATAAEIDEAYYKLRDKYMEDRFLDGEAGNEAARMLTKIQVAHDELLAELAELDKTDGNADGGSAFDKVSEYIKAGDLQNAQRVLDDFNERSAEWHYYQSVVFYRKNWISESKKQLEIAMRLDAANDKYKDAYRKLNDKIAYEQARQNAEQSRVYEGQTMSSGGGDQMGGSFCASCIECCALNAMLNCLCNGCCR